MSSIAEQLLKAGLVSKEEHEKHAEAERVQAAEENQLHLASVESAEVERLHGVLGRVTSLRRFRGAARSLLLLRPTMTNTILELAARLPEQDGLLEFKQRIEHLHEWLPSLSEDDRESYIEEAFK